jgi:hypothetical protein
MKLEYTARVSGAVEEITGHKATYFEAFAHEETTAFIG